MWLQCCNSGRSAEVSLVVPIYCPRRVVLPQCRSTGFTVQRRMALQRGEAGQCVFGRIVLVIVHHRLAESSHLVFTVSRGPYKEHSDGGCKAPTFLPGRTCVTWAPGVSFQDVEAWWQDIIHRPCLQLPSAVCFLRYLTHCRASHLLGTRNICSADYGALQRQFFPLECTLDEAVQVADDGLDPENIQFSEEHFVPQNPFTAGARMLKVIFLLSPPQNFTG